MQDLLGHIYNPQVEPSNTMASNSNTHACACLCWHMHFHVKNWPDGRDFEKQNSWASSHTKFHSSDSEAQPKPAPISITAQLVQPMFIHSPARTLAKSNAQFEHSMPLNTDFGFLCLPFFLFVSRKHIQKSKRIFIPNKHINITNKSTTNPYPKKKGWAWNNETAIYLQKRRFPTTIGAKKHPQLSGRNPNRTFFKNRRELAKAGRDRVVEVLPFNGIILSDNAAPNRERHGPVKT